MLKCYLTYQNVKTEIDAEPIGYDGLDLTLTRNDTYHGISTEYSDLTLKFYDRKSISILKAAYSTDLDSLVTFSVENSGATEYEGQIDFSTYSEGKTQYNYINVKVAQIGLQTLFNNRIEQDVNLNSLVAFDGVTPLAPYAHLDKQITVQGMEVAVKSSAKPTEDKTQDLGTFTDEHRGNSGGLQSIQFLCTGFYNDLLTDLATSYLGRESAIGLIYTQDTEGTTFTDLQPAFQFYSNAAIACQQTDYSVKFRWKGKLKFTGTFNIMSAWGAAFYVTTSQSSKDAIWTLNLGSIPRYSSAGVVAGELNVDTGDIDLNVNNITELYVGVRCVQTIIDMNRVHTYGLTLEVSKDSYMVIKAVSLCDDTTAKVNMAHEALSRVSESITNNGLSVKSAWYGRPDSDINPSADWGAGSLKAITSGLKIRNAFLTDGTEPYLSLSFLDLLKGFSPIDNLGWGIVKENDKTYVRVEPWYWFYKDEVVLTVKDAPSVIRTINPKEVYSRFNFGYKKYETDGINGLDSFMSERTYASRLKLVDSDFEQISEFVADSYAIEYTRRQAGASSSWTYDNDIFVMCLKAVKDTKEYSLDRGVTDYEDSILSPTSLYNARISPARNARRWLSRLFAFQKSGIESFRFTSGTGNYKAKCKAAVYDASIAACADTGAVMAEDGILENGGILLKPEKLTIEDYALTRAEYAAIKANPYGAIMVNGEKCWLLELKYTRKTGKATFTLVPAHDSSADENTKTKWQRYLCGEAIQQGDYAIQDYGIDYSLFV